MKKLSIALTITILAGLLLAACATPTPITIVETVEVPGPERTVVVKETVVVEPEPKTVIEFWSTDHEEERVLVYEQVAADFMAENPDIEVRIVPIDEGTIAQRIATAQAANRLPDVVRMGVERIAPLLASGLLDTDATTQVISDLGWVDTYMGLIIPLIASATATFLFRQFYLTIPDELVDAAKIDGSGPLRFLWSVLLPNSGPSIAALFVVMFIYGWNQYLWPLMVTNSDKMRVVVVGIAATIPTGTQPPEWNLVMAVAMMALIPPVLVVLFMQRWFMHGLLETEK